MPSRFSRRPDPAGRRAGRPSRPDAPPGPRPPAQERSPARARRPGPRAADPLLGRTIGGCEVLERIGSDRVCTSYKANQAAMARLVALRVLSPELAADEAQLARFYETAKFAAQVHHPNIASIYDASSADDVHFSTQEYVEGRSLGELLRARQKLATADALRIAVDAAEAHRFANSKGIPGFRVSADRIILTKRGEVKLLPPALTPAGAPVLGDAYLLPALGILLHAMLTGGRVPDLEAALDLGPEAAAQLPAIKTVALGLRQDVATLVDRLLATAPEGPYASVEAAITDLRRLLEAQEKVESRTRIATDRAAERRKKTLLTIALAGGAGAVALLLLLIALLSRGRASRAVEDEFDQARRTAQASLDEAEKAKKRFTQTPTQANLDAAITLLDRARTPFQQFRSTHPTDPKAADAAMGVAAIEESIRKFRDAARQRMRTDEARRRIKEVDDAFDAEVAGKLQHAGEIDPRQWSERYSKLVTEFPDVPRIYQTVQGILQSFPRRVELARMRIEANQLLRDFAEKYARDCQYGKALDAYRAFRDKYDKIDYLRKEALENYERDTDKIKRDALAKRGLLLMDAQQAIRKNDYARARDIYTKIIANFGIQEHVDRAKEELDKLPKT